MTRSFPDRLAGLVFAAAFVLAAWLPTVTVPVQPAYAPTAPAVELA